MIVRNYLAENFRVDDTRIKTIGLGKDEGESEDGGKVEILVYPAGSNTPTGSKAPVVRSPSSSRNP